MLEEDLSSTDPSTTVFFSPLFFEMSSTTTTRANGTAMIPTFSAEFVDFSDDTSIGVAANKASICGLSTDEIVSVFLKISGVAAKK